MAAGARYRERVLALICLLSLVCLLCLLCCLELFTRGAMTLESHRVRISPPGQRARNPPKQDPVKNNVTSLGSPPDSQPARRQSVLFAFHSHQKMVIFCNTFVKNPSGGQAGGQAGGQLGGQPGGWPGGRPGGTTNFFLGKSWRHT